MNTRLLYCPKGFKDTMGDTEKKILILFVITAIVFFLIYANSRAVTVTFLVTVPEETSPTDTVYIMGNATELGYWDPDAVPLSRNPDNTWQISVELAPGIDLYYYYTKGSWLAIEKGPIGEQIRFRSYTVPSTAVTVLDTVLKWAQFGPYLSWVNDPQRTMTISWQTLRPGDAVVEYGPDSHYCFWKSDSTIGTLHSIELTGLEPSTTYHYRVRSSSGERSADYTFSTAKNRDESFTFVAYGDTRTSDADRAAVVRRILAIAPNLIFNTGDLVEDGTVKSQWNIWFSTNQDLLKTTPYFVAIGNHEQNAPIYFEYWHFPGNEQWYSLDYGNAHFICLSTETTGTNITEVQKAWLKADLQAASQSAEWIFVFFHQPPYSSGSHGSNTLIRSSWCGLFETYGVDIVFSGHDHNYERGLVNGVYYVVTGGGGAPLRPVGSSNWTIYSESTFHCCKISINGSVLNFEAIKPDGTTFDSFTLTKTFVEDLDHSMYMTPQLLKLMQNFPNPFNHLTRIEYQLPKASHVLVTIYNLQGQIVNSLVDEYKDTGFHSVSWNGENQKGEIVASGIYLYRFRAGNYCDTKKMIFIK